MFAVDNVNPFIMNDVKYIRKEIWVLVDLFLYAYLHI